MQLQTMAFISISQLRWCAAGWAISIRRTSPTRRGRLLSLTLPLRTRCSARRAFRSGVLTLKRTFHAQHSHNCISGRSGARSAVHSGQGYPSRYSRPAALLSSKEKGNLRSCNRMS